MKYLSHPTSPSSWGCVFCGWTRRAFRIFDAIEVGFVSDRPYGLMWVEGRDSKSNEPVDRARLFTHMDNA